MHILYTFTHQIIKGKVGTELKRCEIYSQNQNFSNCSSSNTSFHKSPYVDALEKRSNKVGTWLITKTEKLGNFLKISHTQNRLISLN